MTDTHARPSDSPEERLTFHLTSRPQDGLVADTNAIFFWKGRYHLHYHAALEGSEYGWGHVSSPDLVHWTRHPTSLTPSATGHGMLSGGGFMTKEGRPAVIYGSVPDHDIPESDWTTDTTVVVGPAQIVHALDDQLDSWSAPTPVEPRGSDADLEMVCPYDPDAWLEGDMYYALFSDPPKLPILTGGKTKKATVHRSTDLQSWEFVGPFLSTELPETEHDWDISCPNFFPLGNEHMLLCISHNLGCRYYLGEWKDEQFTPTRHGRMNWQPTPQIAPYVLDWVGAQPSPPLGGRAVFFAPETLLTPDGRRVMWAYCWIYGLQNGIQSLPRELSLPEDGILRISPLRELEKLRTDEVAVDGLEVSPASAQIVDGVAGDMLEVSATIRFGSAQRFGVVVLGDAEGAGGLPITVDRIAGTLALGDTAAPFVVEGESVTLRVFVDKAMVEVFADDRQAVIGAHPHPPENVHVGLFADDRVSADLAAWRLSSIYADEPTITPDERGQEVASLRAEGSQRS
jgi:sucrose-6-phosphate hydrolase SacC (GH32 family)